MKPKACYVRARMRAPFERLEPTRAGDAGRRRDPARGARIGPPFLEPLAAPARALARDADLYVDALYEDAPAEGATVLVRADVALRRSTSIARENDVDGEVVEGARADVALHHGLVWRTTSDGEPALSRRLTRAELEERLELVWRPYHRELAAIIERKRARFGVAVVLAAHSMPSVERGGPRRDAVESVRSRRRRRPRHARAPERRRPASSTPSRPTPSRRGWTRPPRRPLRRRLHDAALRPPGRGRPRGPGRAGAAALPRRGDPAARCRASRPSGPGAGQLGRPSSARLAALGSGGEADALGRFRALRP